VLESRVLWAHPKQTFRITNIVWDDITLCASQGWPKK